MAKTQHMANRFRGYLPVIIDVETAGFEAATDALLEIAAVTLRIDDAGLLQPDAHIFEHVKPFPNANINEKSIAFLGIDPFHPFRFAIDEKRALENVFKLVREKLQQQHCQRAFLVGHNAHFDLGFLKAAQTRTKIKHSPFHAFTVLDTASLSALAYGQTVLAKALEAAALGYDAEEAHCALYDAQKTAELFCSIVNRWQVLDGLNQ